MAYRDLRSYAPTSATVATTSAQLLAPDNQLRTLMLTGDTTSDVWLCHADHDAEVGKGFYLPAGAPRAVLTFREDEIPGAGLNAIADGGVATIGIGRG